MPYNSVADSFYTKKLLGDLLRLKYDFNPQTAVYVFDLPLGLKNNVR